MMLHMLTIPHIKPLLVSPETHAHVLNDVTSLTLNNCLQAGWAGMQRCNGRLQRCIEVIAETLPTEPGTNPENTDAYVRYGAALSYYAFRRQAKQPMPQVTDSTIANSIPDLQIRVPRVVFAETLAQDEMLDELVMQLRQELPDTGDAIKRPLGVGAGCVRFYLNLQHQHDKIHSN